MSSVDTSGLVAVFEEARALMRAPGNDVLRSSWMSTSEPLMQIDGMLSELRRGLLPDLMEMKLLFAPTGDLQEVSLGSGWADEFLMLAARFDTELDRLP